MFRRTPCGPLRPTVGNDLGLASQFPGREPMCRDETAGAGAGARVRALAEAAGLHLTESVYKIVSQKSIPPQIRQLFLYISNNKGQVDGFVGELTFAKRLYEHCL